MANFEKVYVGKVSELYRDKSNPNLPLVKVYTDRVSSFDKVQGEIPGMGILRKKITDFFKEKILNRGSIAVPIKNDLVTDENLVKEILADFPEELHPQISVIWPLKMDKFEHIFRIYGAGSAVEKFKAGETHKCGNKYPDDFCENYKFDEIWYTPTTKEDVGKHDEDVDPDEMLIMLKEDGFNDTAARLFIYKRLHLTLDCARILEEILKDAGFILIDGKFEIGEIKENDIGYLVIGDEISTDTLRITPIEGFEVGKKAKSFDKQIIRDYVKTYMEEHPGEDVVLSPEIQKEYRDKSEALYTALTGEILDLPEIK